MKSTHKPPWEGPVFIELSKLQECGFHTWKDINFDANIDICMGSSANCNRYCKSYIQNHFNQIKNKFAHIRKWMWPLCHLNPVPRNRSQDTFPTCVDNGKCWLYSYKRKWKIELLHDKYRSISLLVWLGKFIIKFSSNTMWYCKILLERIVNFE